MARVDHDERRKGRTVDEKCVETPLKTTEHMTSQRTDADWAKTIHRQHIFKNKTRWQSSNTRLVPPLLATIARGPSLGRWLGNLPFQEVDFSHAVFLLHCGAHVPVTLFRPFRFRTVDPPTARSRHMAVNNAGCTVYPPSGSGYFGA